MKRFFALLISLLLMVSCTPALAAEEELPFMEISFVSWNCGEIEDGNYLEKILEEKFNVEIKVSRIDLSNSEQVNLMLAAGEMPEFGWGLGGDELYKEQGLTRLISKEMIETYAPNYTAYINEQPIGWNYHYNKEEDGYMALTGRTYASSKAVMAVRLDWLENLGLEIPEYRQIEGMAGYPEYYNNIFVTDEQWTADELYDVLYAFTHNDPDGNGVDDTYGLQLDSGNNFCWNFLYHMFGMNGNGSWSYTVENEDGSADLYFASETYKNFLEYWAKVYAAGAIDKEYVALSRDAAWEKFGNGMSGVMCAMAAWDPSFASARPPFAPVTKNPETAKILIMPVPTQNDGSYAVPEYSITNYNYNFVARADVSDEKLARMLQIFDYVNFDEEAQVLFRKGQEGVHFNYVNPETKVGGVIATELGYAGKDTGITVFNANYIQTKFSYEFQSTAFVVELQNWSDAVYADHILLPYKLNLFENAGSEAYEEAVELYSTGINTVVSEYRTGVITGEISLEDTWEDHLAELNDLGYAEVREAINNLPTYDDFISGNY